MAKITANRNNVRFAIRKPFDFHLHLREGVLLKAVLPYAAKYFAGALVMPNLTKPVTSIDQAVAYRCNIMRLLPRSSKFRPLMSLYLTETLSPREIARAKREGDVVAVKLYPAGATTNSASGVRDLRKAYRTLEAMQREGLLLLIHGEVTDSDVDVFDREQVFIDKHLRPLVKQFPALKVVLEHVTTRDGVQFISEASSNVAATITPHHLYYNRNHLLGGMLKPHLFCKPVLKAEADRLAVIGAATSGNPKFFAGTDSAPHLDRFKHSECCPAGVFNAPTAIQTYVEIFEAAGSLKHLEAFMSLNGAAFYGLKPSDQRLELVKKSARISSACRAGKDMIHIFRGGETLSWTVRASHKSH